MSLSGLKLLPKAKKLGLGTKGQEPYTSNVFDTRKSEKGEKKPILRKEKISTCTISLAYHNFLNTHGVWSPGQKDAGIDATIPVYFPKTGVYSARATADNAGEYFIGGKKIITSTNWQKIGKGSLKK